MKVSWSNLLVYKVNFILQVVGPMFVFFFIKSSLWTSIYGGDFEKEISGYNLSQMLSYHLWVMVASMVTLAASSQNISEDIRMGKISTYLIYPFSLWEFHTAQFLARQMIQILIALITIPVIYWVMGKYLGEVSIENLFWGILLSIQAGLFWFSVNYMVGMLAFWLEETWTFTVMFQIITGFFSGALIPLEMFPEAFQVALPWTPFPYVSFIPAKAFQGIYPPLWQTLIVPFGWTVLVSLISAFLWRRGLNRYTAAGM